jgi:biopolymer transport protein ExbD
MARDRTTSCALFLSFVVILVVSGARAAESASTESAILCALDYPRPGVIVDYFSFINLNIAADGSLKWNDAPVSYRVFSSYLSDIHRDNPRPAFRMIVEPKTHYSVAAPILRSIQQSGVRMMFLGAQNTTNNRFSYLVGCAVVDHWLNRMPAMIHVHVKRDGTLFWNAQKIDRHKLSDYLAMVQKEKPQPVIDIWPDPETPYENLMSLLSEMYRHEIRDVAFGPYGRYVQ